MDYAIKASGPARGKFIITESSSPRQKSGGFEGFTPAFFLKKTQKK